MGVFTGLLNLFFKSTIFVLVFVLAITFIPGLPPTHIKFEPFTIKPPLKLEGKLAPNSILNNVKVLKLDRDIEFPESVSIRGDELYFGDMSGSLLKVKNGKVTTVAKMGFPCGHVGRTTCSLPLATRFNPSNGKLGFTDIYGGLLEVNVDTGDVKKLVARHEYIEGEPVGFTEDLDISKDGTIYWSDGTSTATMETMWDELVGHASGRLLKYEPSKNKSTVLLKNLHFANGVQLSPKEDFVLVSESVTSRVMRYYLKGAKKGQSDVFIDGLPGYPDNIRSNNKGGFYVSMFSPRLPFPIAMEQSPNIRKFVARTMYLLNYLTTRLYNAFPTEFTQSLNKVVTAALELRVLEPRNGFIIELNEKGEVIGSLQSTNGALWGLSQITIGEKYTYFVSPANTKIWYMNTKDLK